MDGVQTENLLSQLKHLESSLSSFSFESLNAAEAASLKNSFRAFSELLEGKIQNPNSPLPIASVGNEFNDKNSSAEGQRKETKFIAHISHEIRTPLNGIIGFTNLLREDNLSETQSKKVDAIHMASQNLMEIINEVLEYSKLSSGMEDFMSVDFNFHGLINDVIFLSQTLLVDKNIDLQLKIDSGIPGTLIGDPSKLSQILLNLLGNAIKFVEKGYIRLEVSLLKQDEEEYILEFSVADTGIGMSKEQLGDIFKCFKQADRHIYPKYGGTGLGLCIVRELVERQGGEISAESIMGEGSTFKFTMPLKKGSSQNIRKQTLSTVTGLKGKELLNGTKILVFEDNTMNQHLIKEQLDKWGCRVYVTSNADKGLGILRTQQIDIVLMDLKMPGLNGFQITELIRGDKYLEKVPIIAVSADFTAKDEENCIATGINDFLLKPYTLDELLKKLLKAKKQGLPKESKALLKTGVITGNPATTVNLQGVLADCCGEIVVLEELIRLFKQNVYEFIGSAKIDLKQNKLKEIGFAAHKLKAGLKMLQLEKLVDIMIQMQASTEALDEIKLRALFETFLQQYPEYEKQIDSAFAQIKKQSNS
ncbi:MULTISPECIES: hybrid sensor histidine kinase/response regulator [Maribacter]|uniref:histidine kinase n=1 Tax=Maribacter flavus TaxID=1658664 RepID=A0ABU7IJX1_9FLAO|nr:MULTISPECIES: hybrid sensor histidine kinase/response regulator [Maribacter]MDC6405951.1 ATP-binding protein [Maribacter sp. PR66]MEE1973264.1 ATP-binding protein [Maribacter flavus]